MTYILGVKRNGVATIISDSMVTFGRGEHEVTALKTGLLFPGCLYGAAGDAHEFRRFVLHCKALFDDVEDTLEGFWNRFLRLVKTYEFGQHGSFHMLLLSRHSGTPTFYVLDSQSAVVTEQKANMVSLGSGRPLLDERMEKFLAEEHESREEKLTKDGWSALYWPFYYCQELMSLSQGDSYAELQRAGVGGFFYYFVQTADAEHCQEAAVYAVISKFHFQRQLTCTVFRVLFAKMALVIESGATNDIRVCIDEASFPAIANYGAAELSDLMLQIHADMDAQPYCRFTGVVFADPKYQDVSLDWIRGDDAEFAISRDGKMHELVAKSVTQAIAMVDAHYSSHAV